jgi:hypothetical protein
MRTVPLALAAVFAVSGCPGGSDGNPPVLWLALDGSETMVRLIDVEPAPF